jgi:hypothetical protein
VLELAELFRPYPDVTSLLREALARETQRGDANSRAAGNWDDVTRDLLHHIHGPAVTYYTQIFATGQLSACEHGVIVAGLTAAPTTSQARPAALAGPWHVDVHIVVADTSGVIVEGPAVRRITITPDGANDLAAFRFRAVTQGDYPLHIDLRLGGRLVTTVPLTITVTPFRETPSPGDRQPDQIPAEAVQIGGSYTPPPDLDLRVMVEARDGLTTLRYVLHSPNGAADHHYEPAGEVTFTGSPDDQRNRLLNRIEQLTPAEAEEKLRAFGERIYRELLSPQVRRAYGHFRDSIRSLQITSDEPWIPWELVRPFDDAARPAIDDDFWAARFDLARWLVGSTPAPARIDVDRLVCVDAAAPPGLPLLRAVTRERQQLSALAARHGVIEASPAFADRISIAALLEDPSIRMWHFACHGNIHPDHPDEAILVLADGHPLQAEDLYGQRQAAIAQSAPLVVLNACRVGSQGWSLTRLGGWVDAWVRRCRCAALIAPQWSISDAPAADFAHAFYRYAEQGEPLAAAVRAARAEIRAKFPDDPTWLAYSLYAHPNARVQFSAH